MKYELDNALLLDLLIKKGVAVNKGRELTRKIEELETERNKIALQVQKLKDKITPLVKQEVEKLNFSEFEEVEEVDTVGGRVVIKTFDQLEEFTKFYREKKKEQTQNQANENTTDEHKTE